MKKKKHSKLYYLENTQESFEDSAKIGVNKENKIMVKKRKYKHLASIDNSMQQSCIENTKSDSPSGNVNTEMDDENDVNRINHERQKHSKKRRLKDLEEIFNNTVESTPVHKNSIYEDKSSIRKKKHKKKHLKEQEHLTENPSFEQHVLVNPVESNCIPYCVENNIDRINVQKLDTINQNSSSSEKSVEEISLIEENDVNNINLNETNIKITNVCSLKEDTFEVICLDDEDSNQDQELVPKASNIYSDISKESITFDIPLLHVKESVNQLSKEQLEELKSKRVIIKTGKWSKEEISVLKRNYKNFTKKYDVEDPCFLFGIGKERASKESLEFLKNSRFYVQLGRDLKTRTLNSIYKKGRTLFHPFKKQKADKDEVNFLFKKKLEIGNKWTKMGDEVDRLGKNCFEIHRWHNKEVNKGKWNEEEINMLKHAIQKVSGTPDLSDVSQLEGISWDKVAHFVPSRNFSQCRHYWAEHLAWNCDIEDRKQWDRLCCVKLISVLKKKYYKDDESTLNWKEIQESFKNVSPSYIFLQKQWRYFKSKAPKGLSYQKTLKFLFKLYECKVKSLNK